MPDHYDRLHHFISDGVWDAGPLEEELAIQAERMIGGPKAVLVVDDTALPKKGGQSVGVAPQYASALGKTANCQLLVSLTLASREVPVTVGLKLFLPESWTNAPERMAKARVPKDRQRALTKPEIAIEEIDRLISAGVRFGMVLADSGHGYVAGGQDQGGSLALAGAEGAEDVGRGGALVVRRRGARPPPRPAPGDLKFFCPTRA